MEDNAPLSFKDVPIKGDEKLLGAVCHFSIFILPVLLPLVIWYLERAKEDFSEFIIFQAKQSILYQLLVIIAFFGLGIFVMALMIFLMGFLLVPAYVSLLFLALFYAAFGGVQCLMGRDFHYLYIGEKIREFRI